MTIKELMEQVDRLCPNQLEYTDKIRFLSNVEGIVYTEVIKSHEDGEDVKFNGYDSSTDQETLLLIPDAYADVYLYYVESMICKANNEIARYNNASTLYNNAYLNYFNYYNRHHMPLQATTHLKLMDTYSHHVDPLEV